MHLSDISEFYWTVRSINRSQIRSDWLWLRPVAGVWVVMWIRLYISDDWQDLLSLTLTGSLSLSLYVSLNFCENLGRSCHLSALSPVIPDRIITKWRYRSAVDSLGSLYVLQLSNYSQSDPICFPCATDCYGFIQDHYHLQQFAFS